jgi:Lrp/AsnC family transcriptional regulator
MDQIDRKILSVLQKDAALTVSEIGKIVGVSSTPCWRRIQKMQESGVIRRNVALLDPHKVNAGVTVFISIHTSSHTVEWLRRFSEVVMDLPEVLEFYRMSGDVDYLLKVVIPDISSYDEFYRRLSTRIDLHGAVPKFAMEQIKFTTELPLEYTRKQTKAA